jgi:DNA-binding CsgD family transcriptional regulator
MPMQKFEEYLEKANKAKTAEELFEIFLSTVGQHGFNKVLFALLTDHRDIGLSAGVGVIENYPEDWMKYYFENGFDKIDPIVTYGVHQDGTFEWAEIPKKVHLHSKQKQCLYLGEEAGLHNGISIPLRGINNQMAGISLATSEKIDACEINPDLITAYCNHFYTAFKRLHNPRQHPTNILLTKQEREVLTWAANGKSDEDIAEIMKISKHTVNMHARGAFKKLDASNRVVAVVKAISLGIIHP